MRFYWRQSVIYIVVTKKVFYQFISQCWIPRQGQARLRTQGQPRQLPTVRGGLIAGLQELAVSSSHLLSPFDEQTVLRYGKQA